LIPVAVPNKLFDRWGYVDKTGRMVIKPQFDEAWEFSGGLAAVAADDKLGYIDRTGKFVIPAEHLLASIPPPPFSQGLVAVAEQGVGHEVLDEQFVEMMNIVDSTANYKAGSVIDLPAVFYGFIDKTGKPVLEPKYQYADNFTEGMAVVEVGEKFGYVDTTGKLVIEPKYAAAQEFSEGLAAVVLAGDSAEKSGYIDRTGKMIIKPQFKGSVGPFSQGLALVEFPASSGPKYGFIDKTGKIKIKPRFDEVSSFFEGLAGARVGAKWGFINTAGKFVIKPQFDGAGDFSGGVAGVAWEK
jgi:hypothetical protein